MPPDAALAPHAVWLTIVTVELGTLHDGPLCDGACLITFAGRAAAAEAAGLLKKANARPVPVAELCWTGPTRTFEELAGRRKQ